MTDYTALVHRLYAALGTWQRVATACGELHAPSYYWRIGRGEIKTPGRADRIAIVSAVKSTPGCDLTGLNAPLEREARFGLAVSRDTGERLRREKIRRSATWDELLERAAEMLEKEVTG
jgi:hypothetical protein